LFVPNLLPGPLARLAVAVMFTIIRAALPDVESIFSKEPSAGRISAQ
jgi:hypothetical protein